MRSEISVAAAVAAGGALGSLARWGVGLGVAHPAGTFLVNATGCLLIGWVAARTTRATARAFLGTGVLGGYTTFSAASAGAVGLLRAGAPATAAAYALGTLATCVAATALGLHLARRRDGTVR